MYAATKYIEIRMLIYQTDHDFAETAVNTMGIKTLRKEWHYVAPKRGVLHDPIPRY